MSIATGQFTIIDYNDAITLSGYITSNLPKTQQFNPDNGTYSPSWATSPYLILTPSLFKPGSTSDIITAAEVTSVQWCTINSGTETPITADTNHTFTGTKSHILTIKTNDLAGIPAKDFLCKIVYHDPTVNLDLIYKMDISFSRVVNGGGIADAVAWCPDGNIFKNGSVATIKADCDLWRGSVADTSSVTYQWYKQDGTVTTDQGGGIGWRKLDATTNYGITGYTTREIVVPNSAVLNYAVFKCQIKDTDSTSNTSNQFFYDTVTIVDLSDPYQILVTSTGGDVFKNGVGSTTLTAKVYRAGTEMDSAGSLYTYKWYRYDKDGILDPNFGGTGINYKTGKTLAVGDTDVTVKATFAVEVG
jgi:hypothetical protein